MSEGFLDSKSEETLKNSRLERFVDAQKRVYEQTLTEIKSAMFSIDWERCIFPALKGSDGGYKLYDLDIDGIDEAKAYLQHPILGAKEMKRLWNF